MPHILLLGTCDTKLEELLYLRSCILSHNGTRVTMVDVGRRPVEHEAISVSQAELTDNWAPTDRRSIADLPRGDVIKYMIACATSWLNGFRRHDDPFHGIVSAGGSGGTSLVSAVMRECIPIGFPKLLVSTIASGDTGPLVGETDITMMYSVVDIAGTNTLLRRILANAAGAIVGMAKAYEQSLTAAQPSSVKRKIGVTMFGVTTPCVDKIREHLEAKHNAEVWVFHATGHGGLAMERLIEDGRLDAVLDLTTTEICDFLMGGNMSAGPRRLEAALKAGIPCVISLGATDMVNFGPVTTVPEKYTSAGRKLFEHNPTVTLMRTSVSESSHVGAFIADKIRKFATSPRLVRVVIPKGGVSMIATPGGPFADAEADEALFAAVRQGLIGTDVTLVEDERVINDPGFAVDIAELLTGLM